MKSFNRNAAAGVSTACVRVAAEIQLPSPLARKRLSSRSDHTQYETPQRLALCENSGVIAIANGPVVDLYLVNSSTAATASTSSSVEHDKHSGDHGAADSYKHLPFLMQIALDEYKNIQGYAQKSSAAEEQSVMAATCVCFVAPGVLLVGAAKVQDDEDVNEASSSTWLFGFRIYVNTSVHNHKSEAFLVNSRSRSHDPAMVQFSFLERIILPDANGIASMQMCRHCTTVQSGAVVVLMSESSSFGVFQWRERFSDRQVCVAELPGCDAALIAAAMSSDGRWLALSDAIGYLYLLNFELFEWFGTSTDPRKHQTGEDKPSTMLGTKRLRNSSCSRSGILMRDSPFDSIRLASVSGGPEIQSVHTSLRWLVATSATRISHFLLAGIHNGSLSIYPGVSGQRFDPIRQIYARFETSSLQDGFQLFSMSHTIAKCWEVKADSGSSDKPKRIEWPSIKEFFEFPTISLSSAQSFEGVFTAPQASSGILWDMLPASIVEKNREDWDSWMVIVMTETSLQLLLMETQPEPSASHRDLLEADRGSSDIDGKQVLPGRRNYSGGEEESCDTVDDPQDEEQEGKKREMSVATTIQEKYRLPQPSWKLDPHSESEKENRGPQVAEDHSRALLGKEVRFDRKTKMTAAEYDQRVQLAAKRVERLSDNFKMLRNSFQLFTKDLQQHMNDISEQLELAARLRHTRNPRGAQASE